MAKRQIIVGTHGTELERKCGIANFGYNLSQNFFGLDGFSGLKINALVKDKQKFCDERLPYIWRKTNQNKPNVEKLVRDIKKDKEALYDTGLFDRGEIINLEYGIFEDANGNDFSVPLVRGLNEGGVTNILIPHTILKNPEDYEKGKKYEWIMKQHLKYTDQVICMTPSAIDILIERYGAPREKLIFVEHGINKINIPYNRYDIRNELGIKAEKVEVSGGFFSDGKDFETGLRAFAKLKAKGHDVQWYIIGITPSDILKRDGGEKYRHECSDLAGKLELRTLMIGKGRKDTEGLRQLKKYDLSKYDVIFLNSFLNDKESLESKIIATLIKNLNKGKSQIASGEIVRAIEANRTYLAPESPCSLDMAKQGMGFTFKHKNVNDLYEKEDFVLRGRENKGADLYELEMTSAVKKAKFYWEDKSKEIFQILEAIIHQKEDEASERKALGP